MKTNTLSILIAALILFLSACSNVATLLKERELRVDLEYADALVFQNKYGAALYEFERLDKRHPQSPFSDKIIFNIGLLYLYTENPDRDIGKGISVLENMIKRYPKSRYVLYARPLIFYSKEGMEQKTEIEKLRGEIEKLKNEIEKFKDIQIQLEKREKELKR